METIVAALGDNGSKPARKTLEQILAGTLATDDDKAAVEAALKALVTHPSTANDALLFRVLTAPEALRPADRQGPWPAKDLRAKAFEMIKTTASAALRTRLAEALPDRLLRATATNPARDLLLATDPLNCGAQKVLYEKESANKEAKGELKNRLEQQLTGYSAAALARLLKIADDAPKGGVPLNPAGGMPERTVSPAGGTPDKTETDLTLPVADLLWSAEFRGKLEAQLAELHSLERQTQLVLLAATIPQDSTRAALAKLLRKRYIDGPRALEENAAGGNEGNRPGFLFDQGNKPTFPDQPNKAAFPDQLLTDPGLLVSVKMLPRRDTKGAGPIAGRRNGAAAAQPDAAGCCAASGRHPQAGPEESAGRTGLDGRLVEAGGSLVQAVPGRGAGPEKGGGGVGPARGRHAQAARRFHAERRRQGDRYRTISAGPTMPPPDYRARSSARWKSIMSAPRKPTNRRRPSAFTPARRRPGRPTSGRWTKPSGSTACGWCRRPTAGGRSTCWSPGLTTKRSSPHGTTWKPTS